MSEARYGNMHVFRFIILVFIFLIVGMLTATIQAHAVSPWHEVELTPGQTYDVSKAKTNTTVYINKAGDYALKGESTKCRVVIRSGGVNVYLADGLEIDPGIGAYVGSRTAAITVNDMNGTVKLISKPGADIYFGGYLTAPAVRKYGYNSKLVFETEDPSRPGTITAYRTHASSSAGIGSAYEFSGRVSTGNIEINSGNINATGGYMSAGIGGGGNGNAYYITINGGNISAVGGSDGSGIGGGFHGNAANITINGGTVYAEGTVGAGIGSGEQSSYAKNIVINGGSITAKSDTGAAIGGGQRAEVENLRINGGTVNASSRETAIGGSADQHFGDVKSLYITGGKITAKAGHVGIGAAGSAPGPNNIYISGGDITATSDYYAIGGGGFNGALDDDRITNVIISGGTIKADGGKDDIGTNSVWMDEFNVTICGGSVNVDPDKILLLPKGTYVRDQMNSQVNKTVVKLDGLLGMASITDANVTKLNSTYPDYGLKDVRTDNSGTLYFWIPGGTEVTTASIENHRYQGSVASQTEGILYPAPDDTYQVHFLKRELGFDESIKNEDIACSQVFSIDKSDNLKKMSEMENVTPQENKVFVGWQRSKVFGASLYPDGAEVCNLYSYDSQKNEIIEYYMMPKWIEKRNAIISVNVDNKPAEVDGIKLLRDDVEYDGVFVKSGVDKGVYTYDASIGEPLENGEYEIRIRFDAEGDYIDANKTITIGEQNNLVVLDFYTICFNGNGANSGTAETLICAYDQTYELPVCGFQKSGYHFIGWNLLIDGTGVYYKPGEAVKNLYSETNGNVVLYAIWEHDYYTIKYDANGGEGQVPDVQIWTEEEYMLSNPGFMRQDHVLVGWNTEADGSGKVYGLDEIVKDIADAGESVVLYAQWEYDPAENDADGENGEADNDQDSNTDKSGEIVAPDEEKNDCDGETGTSDDVKDEYDDETDTGDRMPIGLIAVIMLAALGVIVAVLFGRKRRAE